MYDVLVIGGGPGGYAAAIRASQLGAKAALIEADTFGGACVNIGCIPSKIWLRSAYLYTMAKRAEEFGLDLKVNGVKTKTIKERTDGVASEIRMGMEALLGNYGVEVIKGRAVFKNTGEVTVDGKPFAAQNIVIATGAVPDFSGIPGDKKPETVDQLFKQEKLPKSALIIGGGSNEVEAAGMLAAFGSKATLVVEGARILPDEDSNTSQRLAQSLKAQGVEIITRSSVLSLKKQKTGWTAGLGGKKEQEVSAQNVYVGKRKPNTDGLGLENTGVALNSDGGIQVNDHLETNIKGIWAIGDVTGGRMLSHIASSMAVTAVENAMGQDNIYPANLISRGLWTYPQVGAVGLSEEEAEEMGYDVETGEFPYAINGLAMGQGSVEGSVKVVSDSEHGDILGVHIVGENATEIIGEAVFAMQFECSIDELAHSIRLHPTFSEAVVDAARDADSWALYLPKA